MNKIFVLIMSLILITVAGVSASNRDIDIELKYGGYYESNLYHSFADSLEAASMLNNFQIDVSKKIKQSKQWKHKFSAFTDVDLYPNYSNRNKTSFGFAYEPDYKYSKKGKLSGDFSFSRRNRDLIDDSGQTLARTLKKKDLDVGLKHRYKFDKFITEQFFSYVDHNYDETYDINNIKTTSYDYNSTFLGGSLKYKYDKKITTKFKFMSEKRNYKERNTYAVVTGVRAGGRLGIREFRENSYDLQVEYKFNKQYAVSFDSEFRRRSENFENFYGYDQWQHRAEVKLGFIEHNNLKISFRIKSKNYENYHTIYTRAISSTERVTIDYTDFQIKNEYEFSQSFSFLLFVRNFDKTSNDQTFDYTDLTIGSGFTWSY